MNTLDKRPDSGSIVENVVFICLSEIYGGTNKINFWRTKAGAEVDFVLKLRDEIIPIEVKFSKLEDAKVSRSFSSFLDSYNPKRGIILTKNFWHIIKKNNTEILFAPVYYL
jgi:predicted AAA+ superfamily ATPase